MTDDIPFAPEVDKLLKVEDKTVCSTAQQVELPCFDVRRQRQVRREDIDGWIADQVIRPAAVMEKRRRRAGHR